MPNHNKTQQMGNITRDPELKYTSNGTAVADFGIAVNRKYGEAKEETTYLDVKAWGKQAELIANHFHKGKPIFLEGRITQDRWKDKETGQSRSKLYITLENFQFIGGGNTDKQSHPGHASNPGSSQLPPSEPVTDDGEEDDIPF